MNEIKRSFKKFFSFYYQSLKKIKLNSPSSIMDCLSDEIGFFEILFWMDHVERKVSLERIFIWGELYLSDMDASLKNYRKGQEGIPGERQKGDCDTLMALHDLCIVKRRKSLINKIHIFFEKAMEIGVLYQPLAHDSFLLVSPTRRPKLHPEDKKVFFLERDEESTYFFLQDAVQKYLSSDFEGVKYSTTKAFELYMQDVDPESHFECRMFFQFLGLVRYFKDNGVKIEFPKYDHPWAKQLELVGD